ncbi:tetratricopeptide repeat protein [Candidatus Mcinerneyibacteriota bacterium]|nr:tetratricopeptide repeat protein [Candidatus Mcinerneyibacteriota bacterium]
MTRVITYYPLEEVNSLVKGLFKDPDVSFRIKRSLPERKEVSRPNGIIVLTGEDPDIIWEALRRIKAFDLISPLVLVTERLSRITADSRLYPLNDIIDSRGPSSGIRERIMSAFREIPLMYLRYYQWANILRLSGKREEATRMYEAAMSLNPSFLPPAIDLCWLSYREKDYKRAEAVIRRVPGHEHIPEFLQLKGKIAFLKGELNRARKYYKKALSLAPFSLKMILEYGRILARSRAYGEIVRMILGKVPEFLEMREKMRRAVRRAVAEGNNGDSYTASRMALRYFPGDREFLEVYRKSSRALGIEEGKEEAEK